MYLRPNEAGDLVTGERRALKFDELLERLFMAEARQVDRKAVYLIDLCDLRTREN